MRHFLVILALMLSTSLKAEERSYGSLLVRESSPDTVYVIDEIKSGDSFELRKVLRNHEVKNIVLASPGGSVFEALQMAGIIHDNKLLTYVPRGAECASACAFLFFAGNERLSDGQLGVHQAYSRDASSKRKVGETEYLTQFTVSEIIGFLNEFGTPPFVYERMFEGLEMYYFDPLELMEINSDTFSLKSDTLRSVTKFTLTKLKERKARSAETKETKPAKKVDTVQVVKFIQSRLNEIGCAAGPADGLWGRKTEAAVKRFARLAEITPPNMPDFSADFLQKLEAAPNSYCPKIAVKQSPKKIVKSNGQPNIKDLSGKWRMVAHCTNGLGVLFGRATLSPSETSKKNQPIYNVKYMNDRSQYATGNLYYTPEKDRARIVLHFGGFSINANLKFRNGIYQGFDSNGCRLEVEPY